MRLTHASPTGSSPVHLRLGGRRGDASAVAPRQGRGVSTDEVVLSITLTLTGR